MLVAIDVSAATAHGRTGVGSYVANMIAALHRLSLVNEHAQFLCFSNHYDSEKNGNGIDMPPGSIHCEGTIPSRLLWMQLAIARSIARSRPDLCHFPNYLAPLRLRDGLPFIVSMYDMSVYRYPQFQPIKTVAVHRALMGPVAQRASMIVTISESARHDILQHLSVPPERVRVVYGGVGPDFKAGEAYSDLTSVDIRQRYGLGAPYILMVGTLEPRKNHARLIDAFAQLVQREGIPHHLVLAGAHGWRDHPLQERLRHSEVAGRIHALGYVPTKDLPALYRGADVFAFPSLYEGFGLPVLEAFASGIPTLISTDAALQEVAGEGSALAVDPESTEEIADGLMHLLTDRVLTTRLRTRALLRSQEFSWDRCAAEMFQIYQEVLDERPVPRRLRSTG